MNRKDDNDIEIDIGYKMSMSEFKGATLNALQNINENIKSLQEGQTNLQNQLNNQKLLAAIIGGFAGVITTFLSKIKSI